MNQILKKDDQNKQCVKWKPRDFWKYYIIYKQKGSQKWKWIHCICTCSYEHIKKWMDNSAVMKRIYIHSLCLSNQLNHSPPGPVFLRTHIHVEVHLHIRTGMVSLTGQFPSAVRLLEIIIPGRGKWIQSGEDADWITILNLNSERLSECWSWCKEIL